MILCFRNEKHFHLFFKLLYHTLSLSLPLDIILHLYGICMVRLTKIETFGKWKWCIDDAISHASRYICDSYVWWWCHMSTTVCFSAMRYFMHMYQTRNWQKYLHYFAVNVMFGSLYLYLTLNLGITLTVYQFLVSLIRP